jgi:hypothetical protein
MPYIATLVLEILTRSRTDLINRKNICVEFGGKTSLTLMHTHKLSGLNETFKEKESCFYSGCWIGGDIWIEQ